MAEIPQATQAKHFQNCSHRHALISFCSAAVLQRGCLAGPSWNKSINLSTSQLLLPLGNPYCSCLLQIVHIKLSLGLTMSLIGGLVTGGEALNRHQPHLPKMELKINSVSSFVWQLFLKCAHVHNANFIQILSKNGKGKRALHPVLEDCYKG